MKAIVSTNAIPEKGMQQIQLIDDLTLILEKQIHKQSQTTKKILDYGCYLPNEGKSQKDQQTLEEEEMTSSGEKSSSDEGWQDSCDLPHEG